MTYDAALAKARWAELERQNDLDWDLDAITDRNEAIAFLQRFENRLCIYSSYVEKLYSNYSFVIPESQEGGITILPDEQAWFDTFHDIPAEAVEPTGIHILPGETMGYSGLYLKIPGEHRLVASREMPFQDGLKLLINRYRMRDDTFLPVLVKGDLREYEARMPSLHLHRLNVAKLQAQSRLNLDAIKGAIAEHLIGLFRQR
ncbi:hypothetical protein NK553_28385 [Pseudomonas sp. ZM23]|uniref:Uncharacterized protein n=1 Tax=Pseudomonas triclosanedens TaxID=2961893 RepID=A0ABY6ZXT9_9PSED|nr:hypothetical protein [Pseudomonas triclosanedens]MCP8467874.1 hypothetical protein [Pseudomonas triclosanedens]MCP8473846.1 hypothetical protein [Pseudomonas triclosanedens]MCP8479828.1 hypothetical protein [Pseudomonas triclosanedens]WAI48768.1 hypothetical protein OU419_23900 [Pseudomonas triclosanedens]